MAKRYADALRDLRDTDRNVTLIITESNPELLRGFASHRFVIERGAVAEGSLDHKKESA
ncbi:MAG: hypothetical protein RQ750_05830 [Roseovarius sp.]|nr:hypothetical protein [Roseovarius sp.]